VGDSCVQCHRRLNSHWSYCPFCGTTNRAHRLEARHNPGAAAARIEGRIPEIKPSEVEEPPARKPVPQKPEKADKSDKVAAPGAEARKLAADAVLGSPPARESAKPPKAA